MVQDFLYIHYNRISPFNSTGKILKNVIRYNTYLRKRHTELDKALSEEKGKKQSVKGG
mgnify:CR=1 FL=1